VPSSRKLKRLVFVVAAALEYTGVLRAVTYVIQDDQRVPLTIESPASQFFYMHFLVRVPIYERG